MSDETHQGGDERDDAVLAGELALGLLSGAERDDAEARRRDDAAFAALVEDWELKLGDFVAEVAPATPDPRLWQGIERSLFGQAETRAAPAPGLWQSLAFWRWLSAGTAALALVLAGLVALLVLSSVPPAEPPGALIAALQPGEAGPSFLAHFDQASGRLAIHVVRADEEPVLVPELWLIPEDGTPRSLGVIGRTGDQEIVIPEPLRPHARRGATLAISLEPEGGSPTGQPTGPVIAAGTLDEI